MFGFKKKKSHSDEKPENLVDTAVDETPPEAEQPISEDAAPVSAVESPLESAPAEEPEVETSQDDTSPAAAQIPDKKKKPRRSLFGFLKKKQPESEVIEEPLTKIPPVNREPVIPANFGAYKQQEPDAAAAAESLSDTQEFAVEIPEAEATTEHELQEIDDQTEADPTVEIPAIEDPSEPEPEPEEVTAEETPAAAATEPEIEVTETLAEAAAIATEENSDPTEDAQLEQAKEPEEQQQKEEKQSLFRRLRRGLSKTSSNLTDGMSNLVLGKREIDDELFEELETRLLMADVGIETTTEIISSLNKRVKRKNMTDADSLYKALADAMQETLEPCSVPLIIDETKQPFVILVIGVNGAGKTTTIGKLAKNFKEGGFSVMLAAGDTFRAAAVEQLNVWGERNEIPVIAQGTGADSASVIFDAYQAAKARNIDILIADTAGRLHTQDNLMEELKKVKRVLGKSDDAAPHETLLVLDGGTGQNALKQGESFNEEIGVTGLAITKLDGTAKGGVLFAMANKLRIPIRYIGVGEGLEDLRVFDAKDFVQALVSPDDEPK